MQLAVGGQAGIQGGTVEAQTQLLSLQIALPVQGQLPETGFADGQPPGQRLDLRALRIAQAGIQLQALHPCVGEGQALALQRQVSRRGLKRAAQPEFAAQAALQPRP